MAWTQRRGDAEIGDDGVVRESTPKVDVLLYALAAACFGVAPAQMWGGFWISVIAAVLLFTLTGGALLIRSRPAFEIPPSMLFAGGLGGAALMIVVLVIPYGEGDASPLLRAAGAVIPGMLLFALTGWNQLKQSPNRRPG